MEQERLSKGIWIPIEIWKDKNLTWNEKILFLEIDSYTSSDKDCFFSNEYISELLGISVTNASKAISSLIEKGYIIKTKFDGRKRYVKTALSYSTSLPCQQQQPSCAHDNNITIKDDIINKTSNKEKEIDKELFEKCWIAYHRKGSKKKAFEYWCKLNDVERKNVLPHIKPYVTSRELKYQKDFERYLRDKIFLDVVISKNNIIYDPTKLGRGETATQVYTPSGNFSIFWDEPSNAYMYIGFYNDGYSIGDGYNDDNRPNGAKLVLNNGRGTIIWNSETKTWIKI